MLTILKNLGMNIKSADEEKALVEIPCFRPDIEREIDLIEEVARINGYNSIPSVDRVTSPLKSAVDEMELQNKIRNTLIGYGFNEIMNNSLQAEDVSRVFAEPVAVMNPLNAEMSVLRTSLIPGGLATVAHNLHNGEKNLRIFETGHIISKVGDQIKSFDNISEQIAACLTISGKVSEKTWSSEEREFDFHDLKGYLNSLFESTMDINVLRYSYHNEERGIWQYSGEIFAGDHLLCTFGQVKDSYLQKFDIKQVVFSAEIFVNCIKRNLDKVKKYSPVLKYPKIVRDMAFVFDSGVKYGDIADYIRKNSSPLLKSVSLFDRYENPKTLGDGKISLAFTLEFYDNERTLTEEEVEREFSGLINKITKNFNAVLRGN